MNATSALASAQSYEDEGAPGVDVLQVQKRYGEERAKRLREEANEQFIDASLDDRFRSFVEDPWVDASTVRDARTMFPDEKCHVLILGAGFGGLLYAIRMVQAGVRAEDIRFVDPAGGFGGTWYWNRYPGLTCDVESYSYLPLLEETGYIPRHRYAYGEEIRMYANLLAEKWGLSDKLVAQTKGQRMVWDEEQKEWEVELEQRWSGEKPRTLKVRARFVVTVNGVLNWPKLPGIPGVLDYKGDVFHASRWDYKLTGGSPTDTCLSNLRGKRVAIIGTGTTAVQIVPHLARWAEHVYVVQRTPSAVDWRGQHETDVDWFKKEVAPSKGWQRERMRNIHQHFTSEDPPAVNLVKDAWSAVPSVVAICGNPEGPKTLDELPAYMQKLHDIDLPRQERIRKQVQNTVKDPLVAEKLKPWYPSWCKRPAFHDEYLSTFNSPNVTLVDTNGKGLDRITTDSIVSGSQSHKVDLIIYATGFRSPFTGSPAQKANMEIIGPNQLSMDEEWARNGPSTQHGVLDHNFPNLFLAGPWQSSLSLNYCFTLDTLATHVAYILAEAKRRAGGDEQRFTVRTTAAGAEDWGNQILKNAPPLAAMAGCTPGVFNIEGMLDRVPPEAREHVVKAGGWGHGVEDFRKVLESWRDEGKMRGVEVRM